jgi:iron-sulfur cluster repair protein YtfE (RIC family)
MTDRTSTVNDLIARHPETVAVFNHFGIDACCGGAVPVREAALRDGADPDALLAALAEVVGETHPVRAGARA